MEIYSRSGELIARSDPPDSRNFDNMIIKNALLLNLELEGISFERSDLSGSDLTGSDLYGSILIETDMSCCNLENVDFRSSFINDVSFRRANLRNARFSRNNLGGNLTLYAADFTDADLDGADFSGAVYDLETKFPAGFDPDERGMIKLEDWKKDHLPRPK